MLSFKACGWMGFFGFLLVSMASVSAQTPLYQTPVPHVLLMDYDTRSILFEKQADDLIAPASTVKLMTAEVIFHELAENRLHLEDHFIVSENAWRTGGALARGSAMFAALGSSLRVDDLLKGLVVVSGNDAAITLAEGVAGSESAFVTLMNERAQILGFSHLKFQNAWGKDAPEQRVTAREMAYLAAHIIQTYPQFYPYFAEKELTWNGIKQQNRNPLLSLNLGVDGLKTGNIDEKSGFSIVASATDKDQRLILALYGAKSARERLEEARKLLQWGFRSFQLKTFFEPSTLIGYASVFGGRQSHVALTSEKPIKLLINQGNREKVTGRILYQGPLMAPLAQGQIVAHLQILQGSRVILETPLQTAEAIEEGSLFQRAWDCAGEGIRLLFRRFFLKTG